MQYKNEVTDSQKNDNRANPFFWLTEVRYKIHVARSLNHCGLASIYLGTCSTFLSYLFSYVLAYLKKCRLVSKVGSLLGNYVEILHIVIPNLLGLYKEEQSICQIMLEIKNDSQILLSLNIVLFWYYIGLYSFSFIFSTVNSLFKYPFYTFSLFQYLSL